MTSRLPGSSGDPYKRREVSPDHYQCGCRWETKLPYGSVLMECPIHERATSAALAKFDLKAGGHD
jgi:hypothetical protein